MIRFLEDNPTINDHYALDESDREISMINLQREIVRVESASAQIPPVIPESSGVEWLGDNTSIYTEAPQELTGSPKIGIKWQCKRCDYDLWVRSDLENQWLFFGNKQTSDGYFNKDYLNSPNNANSLEYVVIERDIDIRKLHIKVNLYSGSLLNDKRRGESLL